VKIPAWHNRTEGSQTLASPGLALAGGQTASQAKYMLHVEKPAQDELRPAFRSTDTVDRLHHHHRVVDQHARRDHRERNQAGGRLGGVFRPRVTEDRKGRGPDRGGGVGNA